MAGDIAYFAAKTIGMSKVNGRKPCDLLTAARHNLREIRGRVGSVGRIDPGAAAPRMPSWQAQAEAAQVQALAVDLLAVAGLNPMPPCAATTFRRWSLFSACRHRAGLTLPPTLPAALTG